MKLSLLYRVKATAALEIESVYQQYCQQYVRTLDKGEEADSSRLLWYDILPLGAAGIYYNVSCSLRCTRFIGSLRHR
ncbi:callose synthase 5-like isoform X4 [Papaver somniferum]|uniref:callose synthase 5-like isoform X4 n=1 Tax=Papaver somniferum TaxID=3469 RepID=UPI000E6F9EA3|nr:callose synthase 5-like isoform X4 [Papaver somniferum]